LKILFLIAALLASGQALAGAQKQEPIDPIVLATLSSQIADKGVEIFNFRDPGDAHRWIYEMSNRLQKRMPDRRERTELLMTVQYEATRRGLDPQLVLGLIEIESGFRKYATSSAGARGLMQVMPFWTTVFKRPRDNLYARRLNIRYGCVILRYYLDLENGDYYRALGRYNGSLGRPEYPNAVNAAWHGRWKYDGATS
jgi:soluble lytic murein transglycosylase-like protein